MSEYTESLTNIVIVILCIALAICILIVLLFFLTMWGKRFSMRKLEYKRYFSYEGVTEGSDIEFIEEFSNNSIFPMFNVDVETHITSKIKFKVKQSDDDQMCKFVSRFFVMPYTKIKRVHKAKCLKRGCYNLESAKITFMKMEVYLDSHARLLVYPREIEIEAENRLNNCLNYSAVSKRPLLIDAFSFAGIKEYSYGESISNINHKATAKTNKLMVNSKDYILGRKIKVYVNFQMGDVKLSISEFEELMEKALSYSSYIAGEAAKNGWQFGFLANCRLENKDKYVSFPMSVGNEKYIELLREMSMIRMLYGYSIANIIDMDIDERISDTEIFLITTYVDESIEKRIDFLERTGNAVTVINILEVAFDEAIY